MPVKTGKNRRPGTFEKGDPRINRKGRPHVSKSLIELRELMSQIADETLDTGKGGRVARLEALLRIMTSSKYPADRKTFLEFLVGKAPQTIDITSGGEPIKTNVTVYLPDNKRERTG